jgi:hypothetical protein
VSASTISRPTENAAIGRVQAPRVPSVASLLQLRRKARQLRNCAFEHLINGALSRAVEVSE